MNLPWGPLREIFTQDKASLILKKGVKTAVPKNRYFWMRLQASPEKLLDRIRPGYPILYCFMEQGENTQERW